jgi:hypothetical protein
MIRTSLGVLLCGTLLLGCGSADQPGPRPGGAGGEGGAGGDESEGGTAGTAGKPATGGTGGVVSTGGSAGSGAGGAGTGGSTGGESVGGSGGAAASPDAGAAGSGGAEGDAGAPPVSGEAPYGCAGCKRLFDGKTLDGWVTVPGAWVVKEGGVLASTGKAADIYTKEDLGDYRIFFQIRHLPAMGGGDHQACTVLFGKRPADETKAARGLGGAQFQPPNGYSWDYGVGGKFTSPAGKMKLDAKAWNQCEIVVKAAGSFKAACCAVGATPCKSFEVLSWAGPGRKHPFDIMMHNAGLFDEYREIWIEQNQTDDSFLSQK